MVGVLEGPGPLADETVVVGAHYDHLGHGGLMSGSLAFLSKDIHNGADDNASGTAMVLELARRLARRPDPLPRRVVFIAFSGEERGLLGLEALRRAPALSRSSTTVMMVNFDMVGRLNDKNELTVYGTGTTPGIDALVDALGKSAGLHDQEDRRRVRAERPRSRSTARTSPSCSPSPASTATTTAPATTPTGSTSPAWRGSPTWPSCSCSTWSAARAVPSSSRSTPRGPRPARRRPASRSRPTWARSPTTTTTPRA